MAYSNAGIQHPIWDKGGAVHNSAGYASLAEMVAAIGANPATILLAPGDTKTLTADLTIPENVALRGAGGVLEVGAFTLTVNGPVVDPGPMQMFDLGASSSLVTHRDSVERTVYAFTGAVAGLAGCDFVRPEWFGARGHGSAHDDAPGFQAALDTIRDTRLSTLKLRAAKTYWLETPAVTDGNLNIDGAGHAKALHNTVRSDDSCVVTGPEALEALLLITGSNEGSTALRYGFRCEGVAFLGNRAQGFPDTDVGPYTAIKSIAVNAPAKPFVMRSCRAEGFEQVIWSDISIKTGTATDGSATTLVDTAVDFTTITGLRVGSRVYNVTNRGMARVTSIAATTLTFVSAMAEVDGTPRTFSAGDEYKLFHRNEANTNEDHTGISNVRLVDNTFAANKWDVRGTGFQAVQILDFHNNVARFGSLFNGECLGISGVCTVTNNTIEGVHNAALLDTSIMHLRWGQNYHETNTGYLVRLRSQSLFSTFDFSPNFVSSASIGSIEAVNCELRVHQPMTAAGDEPEIKVRNLQRKPSLSGYSYAPWWGEPEAGGKASGTVLAVDEIRDLRTLPFTPSHSSRYHRQARQGYIQTPLGMKGYTELSTAAGKDGLDTAIGLGITSARIVVACALVKVVGTEPGVLRYQLMDSGSTPVVSGSITNIPPKGWVPVVVAVNPAATHAAPRWRWRIGSSDTVEMLVTDTHFYVHDAEKVVPFLPPTRPRGGLATIAAGNTSVDVNPGWPVIAAVVTTSLDRADAGPVRVQIVDAATLRFHIGSSVSGDTGVYWSVTV